MFKGNKMSPLAPRCCLRHARVLNSSPVLSTMISGGSLGRVASKFKSRLTFDRGRRAGATPSYTLFCLLSLKMQGLQIQGVQHMQHTGPLIRYGKCIRGVSY